MDKEKLQEQVNEFRICNMVVDVPELMTEHPPVFISVNKKYLYDLHANQRPFAGELSYSRWRSLPLPHYFTLEMKQQTELVHREDIYTYSEPDTDAEKHWYLNFSHYLLFTAYSGSLFAQDEIQVAEHPVLGSLCEALKSFGRDNPEYVGLTVENHRPTPVLIQGAERRIHTDLTGIYGNMFRRATTQQLDQAVTVLNPPTISNIIAMEAPSGGYGYYNEEQIRYIFTTAYTGYKAAVIETNLDSAAPKKCIIHTGNWGCGAYGGHKQLMAFLQILAAICAGVDKLVYHTFSNEFTKSYLQAVDLLNSIADDSVLETVPVTLDYIIEKVLDQEFRWGVSDGN